MVIVGENGLKGWVLLQHMLDTEMQTKAKIHNYFRKLSNNLFQGLGLMVYIIFSGWAAISLVW